MARANQNKIYDKGIGFGTVFDVTTAKPLDSRMRRATYADIKNSTSWNVSATNNPLYCLYPGMFVLDVQTNDTYKYVGATVTAEEIEKDVNWTRVMTTADAVGAIQYKGTVATLADLPSSGMVNGYMYLVTETHKFYIYNSAVQTNNGFEEYKGQINEAYASADEATKLSTPHAINGLNFDGGSDVSNFVVENDRTGNNQTENEEPTAYAFNVTYPDFKTVNNDPVEGTQLRVLFSHNNDGKEATLNGKPLYDAEGDGLDTWNENTLISFTYYNGAWYADILNSASKSQYEFNSNINADLGDIDIYNTTANPVNWENVYNKLKSVLETKMNFIKYNGKKCMFQIVDKNTDDVTISFIAGIEFMTLKITKNHTTDDNYEYTTAWTNRDITVDHTGVNDGDLANYYNKTEIDAKLQEASGTVKWYTI